MPETGGFIRQAFSGDGFSKPRITTKAVCENGGLDIILEKYRSTDLFQATTAWPG